MEAGRNPSTLSSFEGKSRMDNLLRCTISPGQFSCEFGVELYAYDGTGHGMFAFKENVDYDSEPGENERVPAWLHVKVLRYRDDVCLVLLPQKTFDFRDTIAVRADQLKHAVVCEPV